MANIVLGFAPARRSIFSAPDAVKYANLTRQKLKQLGMKIRTIITQDAEVDDQNSLRHFLLYANEVELQGIVQTSSRFHWRGIPGTKQTLTDYKNDFDDIPNEGEFDKPYRWTGTDWMFRVIDDYEKDYANLIKHAEGYPTPDYLRSITKVGNVGYRGETEAPTEGSELIRKAILDDDARTLYLQVWGGCNTIVRALMDIESAFKGTPEWASLHRKITEKVVITACGEQDETYRSYLAEQWPGIQFIKTLQMGSYAYPWFSMPEGESKDTLRADFMKQEILNGKSALAAGYCTWLDGKYYEGESAPGQFGTDPKIAQNWGGPGRTKPQPYDFISEGDSPTFFHFFDWGFRTLENFSYGGISGRYHKVPGEVNSKGETLNYWDVLKDVYIDRNGQSHLTEAMWPYVADIQRDFAARVAWAGAESYDKGEHAPSLRIQEGLDLSGKAGQRISLHAEASSPDGVAVQTAFRVYADASAPWAAELHLQTSADTAAFTIPPNATSGDQLHIIVKAEATGHHRLVHYQHVIISIEE